MKQVLSAAWKLEGTVAVDPNGITSKCT
jgi:hypothetical protein